MRLYLSLSVPMLLLAGAPGIFADDVDFNGRWDLQVFKQPPDKAWWLEVSGAGTPDIKGKFIGFPGGDLNDIAGLKIQDGALHFSRETPQGALEYQVQYTKDGLLNGQMTSGANEPIRFTGYRA